MLGYEIKGIQHCEGNRYLVTVEDRETKPVKIKICDIYLNHEYRDGRFMPKTNPDGNSWNYGKYPFNTPVAMVVSRNGLGGFVRQEFERRFKEQREIEDW